MVPPCIKVDGVLSIFASDSFLLFWKMATINLRYNLKMKETFITKRGRERKRRRKTASPPKKKTENNQTSPSGHDRLVVWKRTIIGKIRTGERKEYPKKSNMAKKSERFNIRKHMAWKAQRNHLQNVQNKSSAIIVCESDFHTKLQSMVGRVHVRDFNP